METMTNRAALLTLKPVLLTLINHLLDIRADRL